MISQLIKCSWSLCIRTPAGVQSLAVLLMELQPSTDGPQILAADALYQLGRVEEAYRLLLSIGPTSVRAPILARLALLQLHRGFLYDTNQVLSFTVVGCKANSRHCKISFYTMWQMFHRWCQQDIYLFNPSL